jgi:hypothetical protein
MTFAFSVAVLVLGTPLFAADRDFFVYRSDPIDADVANERKALELGKRMVQINER